MKLTIPFFSAFPTPTHPNGVHCVETSLKMILAYFEPENNYTIEEIEQITGKIPEKGSWSFEWSIWFADKGYEIKHYTTFDFEAFKESGIDYIRRAYGDETANWQLANSDIERERLLVDEYLSKVVVENKKPTIVDIKTEMGLGFLAKVAVNGNILNDNDGYEGHSVVIIDVDDEYIWFHDPGLPAFENRRMEHSKFQAAMDSFGGEMDVIKKLS